MKARKISLTADMREYLVNIVRNHREAMQVQLTKEKSFASKENAQQAIANDTIILNKLLKK